jgi:threonyl-tRNA synthetase
MCVVGAREKESRSLSVRTYADGEVGSLPLEEVIQRAVRQNAERKGKF